MNTSKINPINIGGCDEDPFYRYKMEKIDTQIIRGGKFTIIVNIEKISKAIGHPTQIICKYISYCTGSNWNSKTKSLTGKHDNEVIQSLILDYITFFVLCEECTNPQTIFTVEGIKKPKLYMQCCACPYTALIVEGKTVKTKKPIKIITGKQNIKLIKFISTYIKDHPMELSAK